MDQPAHLASARLPRPPLNGTWRIFGVPLNALVSLAMPYRRVWNITFMDVVVCVNRRAATRAENAAQVSAKLSSGDQVHVKVVRVDHICQLVHDFGVLEQQQSLAVRRTVDGLQMNNVRYGLRSRFRF